MVAPASERDTGIEQGHPHADFPWAQRRPEKGQTAPLGLVSFRTGEHGFERTESGLVVVHEHGRNNNRFTYGHLGELHFQTFVAPGTPFNLDRDYVVGLRDASQRVLAVWQQRKKAVEMVEAGRNGVSEAAVVLGEYLSPDQLELLSTLGPRFTELNHGPIADEFAKAIDRIQGMGVEKIETFYNGKVSDKFALKGELKPNPAEPGGVWEDTSEVWLPTYGTQARSKTVFPG